MFQDPTASTKTSTHPLIVSEIFSNVYIGRWVTGRPPSPRCSTTDAALCLHLVFKQFLFHHYLCTIEVTTFLPVFIWCPNNSNSIISIHNRGQNLSSRSSSERIKGSGPDLPGQAWGQLLSTSIFLMQKKKWECLRNLRKAVFPILSSHEVDVLIVSLK